MRIGIGVTSLRSKHLEFFLSQLKKHTSDYFISIIEDKEKKGIAWAKNQCLKELKDCDYIFLFDDDTVPIQDGWVDYFVNAHKESGLNHFIYAVPSPVIRPRQIKYFGDTGIQEWTECTGCFMFLTKEVIEKVGYYNKEYKGYGYEHAGYTSRVFISGLNEIKYATPVDAGMYIYCMDFDFHLPFNRILNHKPTLSYYEISQSLPHNREVFVKDIQTIYQNI